MASPLIWKSHDEGDTRMTRGWMYNANVVTAHRALQEFGPEYRGCVCGILLNCLGINESCAAKPATRSPAVGMSSCRYCPAGPNRQGTVHAGQKEATEAT